MLNHIVRLDETLFWIINAHHSRAFDLFFTFVTQWGNGWLIIPVALLLVVWLAPQPKRWRMVAVFAVSLGIAGVLCVQMKGMVRRQRPYAFFSQKTGLSSQNDALGEKNVLRVHTVGRVLHGHSFPSGHSMNAFALATLFMVFFGRKFWPAFVVAILVGYSRIYLGEHFPLDVVASAVIGPMIVGATAWIFREDGPTNE